MDAKVDNDYPSGADPRPNGELEVPSDGEEIRQNRESVAIEALRG